MLDASQHGFVRRLHQAPRQHTGGSDEKHAAGVAEPAILDDGNIDVDDVALFQNLLGRGDAMANHLVDGREDGFWVTLIPHIGWDDTLDIHDVLVTDTVERFRADSRHDVGLDHAKDLSGQLSGTPRHRNVLGRLDDNFACH